MPNNCIENCGQSESGNKFALGEIYSDANDTRRNSRGRSCVLRNCVKIQSPGGPNAENFRNRKSWFSFNVQSVAAADLRIIDLVARWPGSTHDATIFNNYRLLSRLEQGEFGEFIIVADSAYSNTRYIATPLLQVNTPVEALYNESQIRTRNVVERSYGVWKRRFPVLAFGMRVKLETVKQIIVACAILHNIAIEAKESVPPTVAEGFADALAATTIERNNNASLDAPNVDAVNVRCAREKLLVNYFGPLFEQGNASEEE